MIKGLQRIFGKDEIFDDPPIDKVLLNDPLQYFWSAGVIPSALGIDDGDRTLHTDAQTIDFTAVYD